MSNTKGNVRTDKRRSQLMMYAFVGKLVMWLIIIVAFFIVINSILGEPLSYLSWLFNIDPLMLIILMAVIALFFAMMFMRIVNRGMSGKSRRSS